MGSRPKREPRLSLHCADRPKEPHAGRRGVSPRFKALVEEHDWKGTVALDVGCGSGAGTVLLAKLGARAVGVDVDPSALSGASDRAREEQARRARFVCADAEAVDFRDLAGAPDGLDGVLAHLCFSKRIARRASRALKPGGVFIVRSFHKDMWKEAGGSSPFAMSERQMRTLLSSLRFDVLRLEVERRSQTFPSFKAFVDDFLSDSARRARWEEDGRFERLRRAFARGQRDLSEAFLVVEARRRGPRAAAPRRTRRRR